MGGTEFDISLNGPDNVGRSIFYAGQNVRGHVTIKLENEKKCRGIYVKIYGRSDVKWSETQTVQRDGKSTTKTTHFSANICYIEKRITLFGSASGETRTVQPGTYEYDFNFYLKPHFPTSFSGSRGDTKYEAKVVIDRPWKYDNTKSLPFTVINARDLNREDTLKHPEVIEKKKTFCCFLCGSKPFFFNAEVPQTGYVPGQDLVVTVTGRNRSTLDISGFNCKVEQTIMYTVHSPSHEVKYEYRDIVEDDIDGCDAGKEVTHRAVLRIPPVPPTDDDGDRIIKFTYCLLVQPDFGCCHISKTIRIPIIIGTFPIDPNQVVSFENVNENSDDDDSSGENTTRRDINYPMPTVGQYGFLIPGGSEEANATVTVPQSNNFYGFGNSPIRNAPSANQPYMTPGGVLIHPTQHSPGFPTSQAGRNSPAPTAPAGPGHDNNYSGMFAQPPGGYPPVTAPLLNPCPYPVAGASNNYPQMPPYPMGSSGFGAPYPPQNDYKSPSAPPETADADQDMPPPSYEQATLQKESFEKK